LADAALLRNDLTAAETFAAAALASDPAGVDGILLATWLGVLRGTSDSIDGAIATVTNVLAADPGNQRALLYRGKLRLRANRPAEALKDFKTLLKANPQHREAQEELRQLASRFSPA
jgi:tetratricopeptide (TPR) repeat protein